MIASGLTHAPEGSWTVSTYTWAARKGHDIGVSTRELRTIAEALSEGEVMVGRCESQEALVTVAHSQAALDAYRSGQGRIERRERERRGLRKCLIEHTKANPMPQSAALLLDVIWYAVGVSATYRTAAEETAHRILDGQPGALGYASRLDWFDRARRDMRKSEVPA